MALPASIAIRTTFDISTSTPKFKLRNDTPFTTEGITLSNVKGNFKIVNPIGVTLWDNTSTVTPDLYSFSITGITRVGSVATATTSAAHGLNTGDWVLIAGAAQAGYNIQAEVTRLTSTTFSFAVNSGTTTPATGTILGLKLSLNTVSIQMIDGSTLPIEGTYQITLTTIVAGGTQPGTYVKQFDHNFDYARPTVAITNTINYFIPQITSTDNTTYLQSGIEPTIDRAHEIEFPIASGIPTSENSSQVVNIYAPFVGVGDYVTSIGTYLTYVFTDGLVVYDYVSGTKVLQVINSNLCDLMCCVNTLNQTYQNLLPLNPSKAQQTYVVLDRALQLIELYNYNINCGNIDGLQATLDDFYQTTGCSDECSCGGDGWEQLVPINGIVGRTIFLWDIYAPFGVNQYDYVDFGNALYRAIVAIAPNESPDTNPEKYIKVSGVSSGDTLQQAYEAGNTITTSFDDGIVTMRNGYDTDTAIIQRWQNIAGTTTASINGNGDFIAQNAQINSKASIGAAHSGGAAILEITGQAKATVGFWASATGSGFALSDQATGMFGTNLNTVFFRSFGASDTVGLYDFTSVFSSTSLGNADLKIISVSATFGTNTTVIQNRTALWINPTVNYTGGGTGISRGVYINPTLTSAPDWRSIEWSNNSGYGLYGSGTAPNYLNGTLSIGTTSVLGDITVRKSAVGGVGIFVDNTGASGTSAAYYQAQSQTGVVMAMFATNDGSGGYFGTSSSHDVGIAAGGGTYKVLVSTAGNVSIGAGGKLKIGALTAPSYLIDAVDSYAAGMLAYFENTSSNVNGYSGATWKTQNGTQVAIEATNNGVNCYVGTISNHGFALRTNNIQRLSITNDGRYGFGISPASGIFIDATQDNIASTTFNLQNTNAGVGAFSTIILNDSVNTSLRMGTTNNLSNGGYIGTYSASTFSIMTNSLQRMFITATGSVGINTTNPLTQFEVLGSTLGEYMRVGGGTITAGSLRFSSYTTGVSGDSHQIFAPTASGELELRSSTNSFKVRPSDFLFQPQTDVFVEQQIFNQPSTSVIQFGIEKISGSRMGGTIANYAYLGQYFNLGFTFHTDNARRMIIEPNGNVGIGTTTDNGLRFQVNGGASFVLPTSAAGLPTGALWNNLGIVNIV